MSKLAAALGALVLLAGVFVSYINSQVLDPAAAGDRAAEALAEDPGLREAIAPQIAEAIDGVSPLGAPGTEDIADALGEPASAEAFGEAVAISVEDLTSEDRPDPLELNLAEVAVASAPVFGSSALGDIAGSLTGGVDSLNIDLSEVDGLLDALDLAGEIGDLGMPLVIFGVLLLLAALLLARSVRDGVLAVSLSVGVAACLGIAALVIGRTLLGAAFDDPTRDAVVATWDALGGDLLMGTIVAAVAAFVVAVAAALMLRSPRAGGGVGPVRHTRPVDELSPEYQRGVGTEPYRRPPPPPPPPPRPRERPDDPGPPDQEFERRRYR